MRTILDNSPMKLLSAVDIRQRVPEYLHRVKRFTSGAVLDLMPAAGARSGYDHIVRQLPHGGKENKLPDLHRHIVVFPFITEGSRHAAAARRDDVYLVVAKARQYLLGMR